MSRDKISLITRIIVKIDCSFLVLFEILLFTPAQVQQRRLPGGVFLHAEIYCEDPYKCKQGELWCDKGTASRR